MYPSNNNIDKIYKETEKYSNHKLLKSIIYVESNFNPLAKSKKNACGLMQIRPSIWHKELKKENIVSCYKDYFIIEKNIKAGNYILTKLHKQYKGDIKKVLYHYSGKDKNYYKKVMR